MTPQARFDLSLKLLSEGRYSEGWPLYEARADVPSTGIRRPPVSWPQWDGSPGKRLVIWPEQGLGDKIMFARFIDRLDASDITVLCEPALVRLFRHNLKARIVEASGRADFPEPDAWAFYGSLPQWTGSSPASPPYLKPPLARTIPGKTIGVCTRGSPAHPNDKNRSLPPDAARELLQIPGAIDLHPDKTKAADFLETAEIIAGLDLVISVDTAIAHLSAAMGKPTLILLPSTGTDWRWMAGRTDSPWYPSATLLRQDEGGWENVVRKAVLYGGKFHRGGL